MIKKMLKCKLTKWLYFTVFCFILVNYSKTDLIGDYFNHKELVFATIFACSTNDYINIMKNSLAGCRTASGSKYLNHSMNFTNLMHSPYYRMGVYLDYSCDLGKQALLASSNSFILNSSYIWLIKINSENLLIEFEKYNFGLNSDVIVATDSFDKETGNNITQLFDLYKINSTASLITTCAGSYDEMYGLNITLNGSMILRRRDFNGFKFIGTIVLVDKIDKSIEEIINDMENFLDYAKEPQADALSRCVYTFYTYLMDMYNFTVELHSSASFGYPNRIGRVLHDGMAGELENKEIDTGLSPLTMQISSRLDVIHYTVLPVWMFRPIFVFRHPNTLGTYKALVIPFTTPVWVFTVCFTIAIGVILTIIKHYSSDISKDNDKSLSGNIIIAVGAMCQQGLASCSSKVPERIVLLCTLIIGLMIATFYNSMIVTSLLQPPPKYIETPTQLLHTAFTLGLQNHSYFKNLFERATDPIIKEMYERRVKHGPGYLKSDKGMELVQKSRFAFFSEEPIVYQIVADTFTNEELCSLQEIELHPPMKLQLPLRRNSPLMEFFNRGILLMKETGIIKEQFTKWHPHKPECQGSTSIPSVQLQSVLVAYMIFLAGIGFSLFFLCVEILLKKYKIKIKNVNFKL